MSYLIPESIAWLVRKMLIWKSKPAMLAQGLKFCFFMMNPAVKPEWKSDSLTLTADHKESS